MCQSVFDGENEYETIGELRSIMPNLVTYNGEPCDPDEFCLCGLDIDATAKANGFVVDQDDTDPFWFRVVRPRDESQLPEGECKG